MTIDMSPRTRRAVLMGALGGAVAAALGTVSRATPAAAANGDVVEVGGTFRGTITTHFFVEGNVALKGNSQNADGLFGESLRAIGVRGRSAHGTGVRGVSTDDVGAGGFTSSSTQPGVFGVALFSGTGVQGYSSLDETNFQPPAAPPQTGVYGYADQAASSIGVKGESTVGRGVVGVATTGSGVFGRARTGNGVVGHTIAGTGVVGTSSEGVGGRFSGREAPMNLVPANFPTHPGGGHTGDFYVDSSGRLWFCKQGSEGLAVWKQLA
jgi:hypothetical protein